MIPLRIKKGNGGYSLRFSLTIHTLTPILITIMKRLNKMMYLSWIPVDKQLHFLYGFLLTMFGEIWLPLIALGVFANLVKELTDKNRDWMDFVAGCAGSLLGAYFVLNELIEISWM